MSFKSFFGAAVLALAMFASAITGEARAAGGSFALDYFPTEKLTDQAALQNGAKVFVNYCLNCHGVSLMRYNRLTDLGLSEKQIKDNLLFTGEKVGDMMKTTLNPKDAKTWFGALPPDLSLTARARSSHDGSGSDWLYTYLRSYYRDNTRATGWNNAVFANVGMPHALWELQGTRGATLEEVRVSKNDKGVVTGFAKTTVKFDTAGNRSEQIEKLPLAGGHESSVVSLGKAEGGILSQAQYDDTIADLVAFLTYVADPSAKSRTRIGVWVLLFLGLLSLFTWNLNRVFWKDIK